MFLVTYDRKLNRLREKRISREETATLQRDSLAGAGFIKKRLRRILFPDRVVSKPREDIAPSPLTGPFDDDAVLDWLAELCESPDPVALLAGSLSPPEDGYLEVDIFGAIYGAAEVVAALRGHGEKAGCWDLPRA